MTVATPVIVDHTILIGQPWFDDHRGAFVAHGAVDKDNRLPAPRSRTSNCTPVDFGLLRGLLAQRTLLASWP